MSPSGTRSGVVADESSIAIHVRHSFLCILLFPSPQKLALPGIEMLRYNYGKGCHIPHAPNDHSHCLTRVPRFVRLDTGLEFAKPEIYDFIVTLLDRIKEYPNAVKEFFDPGVLEFKLSGHLRRQRSDQTTSYVIWRKEECVLVSRHTHAVLLRETCLYIF